MKVLQINAVYGYKSTGVIVKDIGDLLERKGHESYYAYQSCLSAPKNGFKLGNWLDEKLHAVWARLTGRQGYWSRRATKKLIRWIDKVKPDVVHLHNLHSNCIHFNTLINYLAQSKVATVVTLHDCWFFTGKCSHYVPYGCTRWQVGCGNCPGKKTEVKSWFFDRSRSALDDKVNGLNAIGNLTVVGCSRWIADEVKKSRIKPSKVDVVYNGVDIDLFTPHDSDFRKNRGIADDEFVVMGAANKWCTSRNKAGVRRLVEKNPDKKFVLIGTDDIGALSGLDNVIVLGYVENRQDLADVYAGCDVFVNLTHADTLPTVNMEALCSGTPVITFDVGGSPELVSADCGFVVAEDDFDAVHQMINKVKNGAIVVDVAKVKEQFDKNKCYEKYLEIYNYTAGEGK